MYIYFIISTYCNDFSILLYICNYRLFYINIHDVRKYIHVKIKYVLLFKRSLEESNKINEI